MVLKKGQFILTGIVLFIIFYITSYTVFPTERVDQSLSLDTLVRINQLATKVNTALSLPEKQKEATLNELLKNENSAPFELLFLDWSVKLTNNKANSDQAKDKHNQFYNKAGGKLALTLPVGTEKVKGVLKVWVDVKENTLYGLSTFLRVLFSASLSGLLLTFLSGLKARKLIRSIESLCQKFTLYRREHESNEMAFPEAKKYQSVFERRIDILNDLWERFSLMQSQLSDKVFELEESQNTLKLTIVDLEEARKKEARLIELGYALAEFGHDIGNANGSILSFCELIIRILNQDSINLIDLARCPNYARKIKLASESINGLTSDLLEFAKGKTQLNKTEVYQKNFVKKLEVNFGFLLDFPIKFNSSIKPNQKLFFDEGKIVRVMVNLVKNAWEKLSNDDQGQEEGLIQIGMLPYENNGVLISVIDNGETIDKGLLPNMFGSFQTSGKQKGTGLGLAIAKKIIEAHGGKIKAENLKTKGVKFSFFIPQALINLESRVKKPANTNSKTPSSQTSFLEE